MASSTTKRDRSLKTDQKRPSTMDDIDKTIEELQSKLNELQRIKMEQKEHEKKNDVEKNLDAVKDAYEHRKEKVSRDRYSKSCIVAKFIDRDMIGPLEAIYNVLNNLNDRIAKLEED